MMDFRKNFQRELDETNIEYFEKNKILVKNTIMMEFQEFFKF